MKAVLLVVMVICFIVIAFMWFFKARNRNMQARVDWEFIERISSPRHKRSSNSRQAEFEPSRESLYDPTDPSNTLTMCRRAHGDL